jgi:hypothetical protein
MENYITGNIDSGFLPKIYRQKPLNISLLGEKEDKIQITTNNIDNLTCFMSIFNQAILKLSDVKYLENERKLLIKLNRYYNEKPSRWFKILDIKNSRPCELEISDIDVIKFGTKSKDNTIILGGVIIHDNEITIWPRCDHASDYFILIKVRKINIHIKDIQ